MAEIIPMPLILRISDRTDPELKQNSRSGGVSLSGTEQIITPLAGRWEFAVTIPIFTKTQARAWRAFKSKLLGRFNYAEVRVADAYRLSRKEIGAHSRNYAEPFDDDALFGDNAGFALAQPAAPLLVSAAVNDTLITIDADLVGNALVSGVFFSINGWLYLVSDYSISGGVATITVNPPLRAAQTAGDIVDFDAKFVGRLSDDSVPLQLAAGKFGGVQFTLIEDISRGRF